MYAIMSRDNECINLLQAIRVIIFDFGTQRYIHVSILKRNEAMERLRKKEQVSNNDY